MLFRKPRHTKGSTLVVTMVLSAFLILAVLTLLALATGAAKVQREELTRSQARANAMLALKLAMADLQKQAGPDQRVTATSGIIDGAAQGHLTGVWDSWRPDPFGAAPPDYVAEKQQRFRRWLVSGLTEEQATDPSYPTTVITGPDGPDQITLYGEGSLGSGLTEARKVRAGKVSVLRTDGSSAGATAFAVLDEGVKARVNLKPPADAKALSLAEIMMGVATPSRNAVEKADATLATLESQAEGLASTTELADLELLDGMAPGTLKPFSHDLSTHASGVLADVARGGLRRDLSLFAEFGSVPSGISTRKVYPDSALASNPENPEWSLLYTHLRGHRELRPVLGNPGVTRTSLGMLGRTTVTLRPSMEAEPARRIPDQIPVITRCDILYTAHIQQAFGGWATGIPQYFSSFGGGWNNMVMLSYQPTVTLWNPYNVPMECSGLRVEIEAAPVAFRFRRLTAPLSGYINSTHVPASEFYVRQEDRARPKRYVMDLTAQPLSTSSGRTWTLQPGESRVFSAAIPETAKFNASIPSSNSQLINTLDWVNQDLNLIGTPGWQGHGYGFSVDWLNPSHNGYTTTPGVNAPHAFIGVIGSRLTDTFDIEVMPMASRALASDLPLFAVTLSTWDGDILSRIEFPKTMSDAELAQAMTPPGGAFPLVLTDYSSPLSGSQHYVSLNTPRSNFVVKPIAALTMQAKTSQDSRFPNRPWLHGDPTKPYVVIDLSKEKQSWRSHELVLRPLPSTGDPYHLAASTAGRAPFLGGHSGSTGSLFGSADEISLHPVQGVARLSQFGFASRASWSAPQSRPLGRSLAHPLLPTNVATHRLPGQAKDILDHTYLANDALWDSWYASTIAFEVGQGFLGTQSRNPQAVAEDFFLRGIPLGNRRLRPWFGSAGGPQQAVELLTNGTRTRAEGDQRAAAFQMLDGAFNVNSTSVAAWKAMLSGMNGTPVPLLLPRDSSASAFVQRKSSFIPSGAYFCANLLANSPPPGRSLPGDARWSLWQGGRELSDAELQALAEGIVREVKRRGPFLSLGEFVNRRLGSTPRLSSPETVDLPTAEDRLYLMGAIENAIQDAPGHGNLNHDGTGAAQNLINASGIMLQPAHVGGQGYPTPEAALGSTVAGASAYLDQLSVLTQIGSYLSARSDTFRIRIYGEAPASGGGTEKAFAEAIIQRVPDYVDTRDEAFAPPTQADNLSFGRRFQIVSFRWLDPDEV